MTPSSPARTASPLHALARHPWYVALGLLVVTVIVLLMVWDWNWFKGTVERQVLARTGRSLDIAGNLDVDLGRITTIRASGLRFGNAAWSREPTMASVDKLQFGIEIWPLLLRRQVRIPDIRLTQARLRLEKGPNGIGNWVFGSQGNAPPQFGRLWIDDGRLRFIDTAAKTDIDVAVNNMPTGKADAALPIQVAGGGKWQGNPFTVRGKAQSPLALRDKQQPYRIDAYAQAGTTRAHARGSLVDPLQLRDFDLKLALQGNSLEELYRLLGIAAPPSPPYAFDGRLTRGRDGGNTIWRYDGFTGKVGDSDLSGKASVTTGGARPYLRATLVSRRLVFADLAVFIGKPPQGQQANKKQAMPVAQPASGRNTARVLPDAPYDLEKLRAMDADVRWKAEKVASARLPLDDMHARLLLENGLLQLIPLDFGVADGNIRAQIRLDARKSPIHTRADITGSGLNLGKLMPEIKLAPKVQNAIGKVGGKVALTGHGNSIADMLGSADGAVAIGMGQGQVSKLLMEMAGLNIAGILKIKLTHDSQIPIRCAFGDFAVDNGVMSTRRLAFDTSNTVLVGTGTISLRDETIDLTIKPHPKGRSLLSLRSPLYAEGTFKQPRLRPDYKRIGLRGAAALVLGSIFPPAAALVATTDLGGGKNSDCGGRQVN